MRGLRAVVGFGLTLCVFSAWGEGRDGAAEGSSAQKNIDARLAELTRNRKPEQVRVEIAKWKKRAPHSIEPYLAGAIYEWSLARQPVKFYSFETHGIPRFPVRAGTEYVIVDPKTGREEFVVGEMPVGPKPDPQTVHDQLLRGAAELGEALKKFPDRLDAMIARCIALSAAAEWEAFAAQMDKALEAAATRPGKLRWVDDQPPRFRASEPLLSGLQGVIQQAFQERDQAGFERARRMAELALKFFPQDPRMLCDIGSCHVAANDWKNAATYFEQAREHAPQDAVVCFNLGQAYSRLGRMEEARQLLQQVALDRDPEIARNARQLLQQLDAGSN